MRIATGGLSFWMPAVMPAGAPPMRAHTGILVDLDTGEILWARQPHLGVPPASLTKVLTALVALENLSPGQEVTVTADALGQSSDDTLMGLKAGQTLTVEELLDGMLLPSGDDAASAIAADTVGTPRFVAAMNAQVAELELHDSLFSATAGLDDPHLYASAYDMAVITAFTYDQFPLFDEIVDTRSIQLPADAGHPGLPPSQLRQPSRGLSGRRGHQARLDRGCRRVPDRHGRARRAPPAGGADERQLPGAPREPPLRLGVSASRDSRRC